MFEHEEDLNELFVDYVDDILDNDADDMDDDDDFNFEDDDDLTYDFEINHCFVDELTWFICNSDIYIDTNIFMDKKSEYFFNILIYMLKNSGHKVVIIQGVLDELERIQKNDKDKYDEKQVMAANKGLAMANDLLNSDLAERRTIEGVGIHTDRFADKQFDAIFALNRTSTDILLITKDKKLCHDMIMKNNMASSNTQKRIFVRCIDKDDSLGYLVHPTEFYGEYEED